MAKARPLMPLFFQLEIVLPGTLFSLRKESISSTVKWAMLPSDGITIPAVKKATHGSFVMHYVVVRLRKVIV